MSYTISHLAYTKLVLHSAKHPHAPVNGVLLGTRSENFVVEIVDTIPLLHNWTSLSPMMEIGLDLARSHAEERQLKLVGYYQATDKPVENSEPLKPVGEKVASSVLASFSEAFAIVIDGNELGSGSAALIPYLPSSSTKPTAWTRHAAVSSPQSKFTLSDPSSPTKALAAIRDSGLHREFGDFDDHLEDVTIDWLRNAAVGFALED